MKEIQITFHKRIQQSWIYFSAFSRVLWSVFLQHEANTPNYTFTEEKWTKNHLTEVSPLSSHNYKRFAGPLKRYLQLRALQVTKLCYRKVKKLETYFGAHSPIWRSILSGHAPSCNLSIIKCLLTCIKLRCVSA